MLNLQSVKNSINSFNLLALSSRKTASWGSWLSHELVMIPLNVVNANLLHERIHSIENITSSLWIRQVENLLHTSLHWQTAGSWLQNPIRMSLGYFRNRIKHFWLEPQTKFHALSMNIIC